MHKIMTRSRSFALIVSLALVNAVAESELEPLTAKDLLDRMAKTYAGCASYRDSGVVKTTFIEPDRSWVEEKPFTTTFVRPDRYRFEFWEKNGSKQQGRYLVWRAGNEIRTWWEIKPGVATPPSLGRAVAGATGVSGGSAHTIPALLLGDEIGGRRLTEMKDAKRIGEGIIGKTECCRVHGYYAGNPMTLWLDKKTYLVLKIEEAEKDKGFRTLTTTSYEAVINSDVAEKTLEFNPPKKK